MKKLFGIMALAAIAAAASCYRSQSQNELKLSDLALANVEALARDESGGSGTDQACIACISPEGYRGVRFYCKYGTGGCYDSTCIAGSCGGL